jgi:hypothetical protein
MAKGYWVHMGSFGDTMNCTICNDPKHRSSHCPCLHDVLKEGFYSGGNGGGGHDHDEEDRVKVDRLHALRRHMYDVRELYAVSYDRSKPTISTYP